MTSPAAKGPIDQLYRQSLTRPRRGDHAVLRGRMALDELLDRAGEASEVHRIYTIDELVTLFAELTRDTHREILGMLPDSPHAAESMGDSRDGDLALLQRGVRACLIYEPGWVADPAVAHEVRIRMQAGAKVRVIDRIPHRVTIFDGRTAVMPVEPGLRTPGALVVREHTMVASLRALYASIWRRATAFDDVRTGQHAGCSDRDRQVLALMSRGDTDESAARTLDVSLRTYRRYVADVLARLGANSRFQAGVKAVERGWL